jgi:hypothetical protein
LPTAPLFATTKNTGWSCKKKLNKKPSLNDSDDRKPLVESIHKEVKSWDSTSWSRVWQYQTLAWKRDYLRMHLLAEWLTLWGHVWGFLKDGVMTYLMAPISPRNSSKEILSSHL